MRNITTIILICILSFPAFGQETDNPHKDKTSKSIYPELLGASNMIGVSYDTRIKPGSVFGYRAGISYFYGTNYTCKSKWYIAKKGGKSHDAYNRAEYRHLYHAHRADSAASRTSGLLIGS